MMKNVDPNVFSAANFRVWSTKMGISIIAAVKQKAADIKQRKKAAMRWKRFSPHGLESAEAAAEADVEVVEEEKLNQLSILLFLLGGKCPLWAGVSSVSLSVSSAVLPFLKKPLNELLTFEPSVATLKYARLEAPALFRCSFTKSA